MENLSYFGKTSNVTKLMNRSRMRKLYHGYITSDINNATQDIANLGISTDILNTICSMAELVDTSSYTWDYSKIEPSFSEPDGIFPSLTLNYSNASGLSYPTINNSSVSNTIKWDTTNSKWDIKDISQLFELVEIPTTDTGVQSISYGLNYTSSEIEMYNTFNLRSSSNILQVSYNKNSDLWVDIYTNNESVDSCYIIKPIANNDEKSTYLNGLHIILYTSGDVNRCIITEDFFSFYMSDLFEIDDINNLLVDRIKILPNKCFIDTGKIINMEYVDMLDLQIPIYNIRSLDNPTYLPIPIDTGKFTEEMYNLISTGLDCGPSLDGAYAIGFRTPDIKPININMGSLKDVYNIKDGGYSIDTGVVGRRLGAPVTDGMQYYFNEGANTEYSTNFNITTSINVVESDIYSDFTLTVIDGTGITGLGINIPNGILASLTVSNGLDIDYSQYFSEIGSIEDGEVITIGDITPNAVTKSTKIGNLYIKTDEKTTLPSSQYTTTDL